MSFEEKVFASRAAAQSFARKVVAAGGAPTLFPPDFDRDAWSVVYEQAHPGSCERPNLAQSKGEARSAPVWTIYAGGVQGLQIDGRHAARGVAHQLAAMWSAQTGQTIDINEDGRLHRIAIVPIATIEKTAP